MEEYDSSGVKDDSERESYVPHRVTRYVQAPSIDTTASNIAGSDGTDDANAYYYLQQVFYEMFTSTKLTDDFGDDFYPS